MASQFLFPVGHGDEYASVICRLFVAKPLPEPAMTKCLLGPEEKLR